VPIGHKRGGIAYDYEGEGIRVSGTTQAYVRGRAIEFHFCPTCGGLAFWRGRQADDGGRRRIAVNLRLAEPGEVARIPHRPLRWLGHLRGSPARRALRCRLLVL